MHGFGFGFGFNRGTLISAPDPTSISNLVLWLDDTDASTVSTTLGKNVLQTDKSGNGNTFVQTVEANQLTYVSGEYSEGDGTGQFLEAQDLDLQIPLPLTLAAWVYFDTVGAMLVNTGGFNEGRYCGADLEVYATGEVRLNIGDNRGNASQSYRRSKTSAAGVITAGSWFFVSGTIRTKDDMTLYVNGIEISGTYSGFATGLVYNALS